MLVRLVESAPALRVNYVLLAGCVSQIPRELAIQERQIEVLTFIRMIKYKDGKTVADHFPHIWKTGGENMWKKNVHPS
jgi:hypothetical protein